MQSIRSSVLATRELVVKISVNLPTKLLEGFAAIAINLFVFSQCQRLVSVCYPNEMINDTGFNASDEMIVIADANERVLVGK